MMFGDEAIECFVNGTVPTQRKRVNILHRQWTDLYLYRVFWPSDFIAHGASLPLASHAAYVTGMCWPNILAQHSANC